jgi:hypothetical protein
MVTALLASMGQMVEGDPIQRTVALATHVLDEAEAQDGVGILAAAIERIATPRPRLPAAAAPELFPPVSSSSCTRTWAPGDFPD